jgi:uncharacterized membrane protein
VARRQEEAENHWPGFVDALSTIVMVVTFLLIILGIVIFALSLQINDRVGEEQASANSTVKIDIETESQNERTAQDTGSGLEGKVGKFKQNLGKTSVADKEVESDAKLAVRSQEVRKTKEITVASDETDPDKKQEGSVTVTAVNEFLTLTFDSKLIKIDDKADQEILAFMTKNPDVAKKAKLEIWSFADSKIGSITEARRVAYYRAMNTRNSLLKAKIDKKNITVRVRETDEENLRHKVKVIIK